MTEEIKRAGKCVTLSVVNVIVGWAITFGSAMYYISQKDTSFTLRISAIEKDIEQLDGRLDTSEAFRSTLMTDLAEIKTDLLWIRRQLDNDRN